MLLSVGVAKESFRRTACVWLGFGLALLLFGPTGIRPRPVEAERPPRVSAWVPAVPAETAARSDMSVVPAPDPRWPMLFVRGYSDDKPTIWVCRGDGTEQRKLVENGRTPCWSPDRKRFAFVRDNQVWVADVDGGNQRKLTTIRYASPLGDDHFEDIHPTWDPIDRVISFTYPEHWRIAAEPEVVQPDCWPDDFDVWTHTIFDVAPDGDRVGRLEERYSIIEELGLYTDFQLPTWSPNGRALAMTCSGNIWIVRRDERRWAEGGEDDAGTTVFDHWHWNPQSLIQTADHDGWHHADGSWYRPTDLSWSPDCRKLVYTISGTHVGDSPEMHLAEIEYPDYGIATLVGPPRDLGVGDSAEFSPDGRFIAFGGTLDESYWQSSRDYDGIVVMAIDGGYRRLLVHDGCQPAW